MSRLQQMSIGWRLASGFAAIVVLFLATVAVTGQQQANVQNRLVGLFTDLTPHMVLADAVTDSAQDTMNGLQQLVLAEDRGRLAEIAGVIKSLAATRAGNLQQLAAGQPSPEVGTLLATVRDRNDAFTRAVNTVVERVVDHDQEAARRLVLATVEPAYDNLVAASRPLSHHYDAAIQASIKNAYIDSQLTTRLMVLASLASAGLGAVCAYLIIRSITTPIHRAVDVLGRVAHRDLTARLEGAHTGELAVLQASLNTALASLDGALAQAVAGSRQVAAAAVDISGSSQALAQGANDQASTLVAVSTSIAELAEVAEGNTRSAGDANEWATATHTTALQSLARMEHLSASIVRIKSSADEMAKIVRTIDEIANQTNLLALNAAVEAARAGTAGRGFAVVAEEVRSLALRSAEAAQLTADLIEQSVRNAEEGVQFNTEVSASLAQVGDHVVHMRESVGAIAEGSTRQKRGIDQVNQAVSQMNHVTQQTAASAQRSAAASEELTAQSAQMGEMVGSFRLTGGAPTAAATGAPANVVPLRRTRPDATERAAGAWRGGRAANF